MRHFAFLFWKLRPWRIKRRREVPCRIENSRCRKINSRYAARWQLRACRQLKRCQRRRQSVVLRLLRIATHHARRYAFLPMRAHIHFHRTTPAAARHRALLRRIRIHSRHQCQRHRQQRHNQTRSLYSSPHQPQSYHAPLCLIYALRTPTGLPACKLSELTSTLPSESPGSDPRETSLLFHNWTLISTRRH
jgi:hypothetical protein